ncbi:hypothetical protein YYC_04484 [Plasmodium yoelii 17X]|uniref:RNA-binding protein s1 n=4 Tax=Plasmodium yoelii TaxID=5861 RepID=A0AAF0B3Z4_PLAYO|nr:RNA-binding protein S1 [Plasmodium yoelii]EAA20456.1 similar to RNA-binding protein S1, serine-rich domain [Plasmodium yoelii yoelii]ETB57636.1 hypothetical protein YYC_04484 [Plasmodium yoelii 17X]WBY57286.1 RNA-binding protein s1 [Plasmodium yoelii yoelii]CDU17962.1 RNA-binding protein s1, putative [Plasmodium yoelii]VTZ78379.1 RNA-binding protein s1, putative [Plasmodium yoelii]|eukprot:XP_728891.1 RNA-binding protein S1 [Plasmodium yoelii]
MTDNCLYVYNLTKNTSVEHLNEIFMNFGKLIDINYVLNDDNLSKDKNDNLIYAKIEFENPNDAKTAIEYMDGGQIDGKTISIKHEHEIIKKNNNKRVSKERNEKDDSYKYSASRSSSSNSSKAKSNTSQIKKKNKSKKKQKKYK